MEKRKSRKKGFMKIISKMVFITIIPLLAFAFMGCPNVTPNAADVVPTYTVTYNGNGSNSGKVPVDSNNYEEGDTVTVLGNTGSLVKDGYTFAGWNTQADGNGTGYAGGVTLTMGAANVTLYAKWTTKPTYTVTYHGNGNTGGFVPTDTNNYEEDAVITVLGNWGNLEKTGYAFVGWTRQADGNNYLEGETFLIGTANVNLYAKWEETYTVTYDGNGNDGGIVPVDSNNYLAGATVTVLPNTGNLAKAGYTFAGWNTQADGNGTDRAAGSTFAMGSADVTLYAKWGGAGYQETYTAEGVSFKMGFVPGGYTFPTGIADKGPAATVNDAYWIGETEVTYELWYKVYTWATGNGYNFANTGRSGNDGIAGTETTSQEPVTTINWRDSMVWCNALTEWYNAKTGTSYACVYKDGGIPIRDSQDGNAAQCDGVTPDGTANGFRLLTSNEWELAARYIDDANSNNTLDIGEYYPGYYASGADAQYDAASGGSDIDGDGDTEYSTDVAVFSDGSTTSTAVVKSKSANKLGLYDMSGNVWEWCFDLILSGGERVLRGGGWGSNASYLRVGYVYSHIPYSVNYYIGFRPVRTP